MNTSGPIGVFDSGIGGITVLKEIIKKFPHEDIIYFADTLNLPYGEKTPEQIKKYSYNIISWMQNKIKAKIVVAACHTSSAVALSDIIGDFNIPIIDTIYPTIEVILKNNKHKKIGIIATPTTAKSKFHEQVLKVKGFEGEIHSISCPDFVPLIEVGNLTCPKLLSAAKQYLEIFHTNKLDTLIFGCTHYPLIEPLIRTLLPGNVHFIDPACHMVNKISLLFEQGRVIPSKQTSKGKTTFYCSKSPEKLKSQIITLMNIANPEVMFEDLV
jgi:glutamate racemase